MSKALQVIAYDYPRKSDKSLWHTLCTHKPCISVFSIYHSAVKNHYLGYKRNGIIISVV